MQTHSMSSIVAATPDQPRQPAVGLAAGQSSGPDVIPSSSQPIGGQDRGQSSIREPALRRRPTRTALTLSRTSTSLNLSPVRPPLRYFHTLLIYFTPGCRAFSFEVFRSFNRYEGHYTAC